MSSVLASLGPKGFKSKSSIHPEGGVQSSIQNQTSSHPGTFDKERIYQSPQEQLPAGGIAFPPSATSCGKSKGSMLSGVLQQAFHCPETKSKMAANLRSQCPQPVSQRLFLQQGEWVTLLDISDVYFHIPISPNSLSGSIIRPKSSSFKPFHLASLQLLWCLLLWSRR